MEKWSKIEALLNILIMKAIALLRSLSVKLTPQKFSQKVQKTQSTFKERQKKLAVGLKNSGKNSGAIFKKLNRQFRIIYFAIEEKLAGAFAKIKTTKPKELGLLLIAFLAPFSYKIKAWWAGLRPESMVLILTGGMFSSLTMIGLVTSGSQLSQTSAERAARAPASIEESFAQSSRPDYYKLPSRTYTVLNVQLPIYVGTRNDLRSVLVDFTVISSNQYIRRFFLDNETLVHDRLATNIEPIEPGFTFEVEGKNVLKEKIQFELNGLLNDFDVKGEIQEVHVHSMLAL